MHLTEAASSKRVLIAECDPLSLIWFTVHFSRFIKQRFCNLLVQSQVVDCVIGVNFVAIETMVGLLKHAPT